MINSPDWYRFVLETPLAHQPGENFTYSSGASMLMSRILRVASNRSTEEFARTELFEPLGMDQTMAWVPPEEAHLLATVYTHDDWGKRTEFEGSLATNHFKAPGGFSGGGGGFGGGGASGLRT